MVIGYAMADNYKTPLIAAALKNAARNVTLDAEAIFHSDRGSWLAGDRPPVFDATCAGRTR